MCDCRLCSDDRRRDAIVARADVLELKALIHELREDLANTEGDLNYHHAIQDGSWPSAAEFAAGILRKVQARAASRAAIADAAASQAQPEGPGCHLVTHRTTDAPQGSY